MEIDLPKETFDWIIFGTDLTESILASNLAMKNQSILVLDISQSYSGLSQGLNLREIVKLAQKETSIINVNETLIKQEGLITLDSLLIQEDFRKF